jgi:hypothetical protein
MSTSVIETKHDPQCILIYADLKEPITAVSFVVLKYVQPDQGMCSSSKDIEILTTLLSVFSETPSVSK